MKAVLRLPTEEPGWLDLRPQAVVVAYGVRIGIGAPSEQRLAQLRSILPPGARSVKQPLADVWYTVRPATGAKADSAEMIGYEDGRLLVRSADYRTVLQTLESQLHLYVAEYAPLRVFVHAGVVGWKDRTVVIPGRTYSGKSTLVAALLRAGATYYSDEFAVVDSQGRVHPYAKPIQIRDRYGVGRPVDARQLPAAVGTTPLKVGLVLVTRHREGARWRPTRISPGEGMLALLSNTVSAQREPRRALRSLQRLLDGARVLKGDRGEADHLIAHLVRSGYLPS
jgi:hypothetical protein